MAKKKTERYPYFKKYFRLTDMGKKKGVLYFLLQLFLYTGYVAFYLLTSIFAAKTINGIYMGISSGDFTYAYTNLALELFTIIARNVFYHLDYLFYPKLYCFAYDKVQNHIFDKLISCEKVNYKDTSRQKIFSIVGSDVGVIADFADQFIYKIGALVFCIVPFVYIFSANIYAGLVVVLMCFVNFFILRVLNKKIARGGELRSEARDALYEVMDKTMDGQNVIREFDQTEQMREELNKTLNEKHRRALKFYYRNYSNRGQLFYIFFNVIIYAITACLIFLISKGTFDIETYLVVVPYLLTCITKFNDVANITQTLEDVKYSVKRVDTILSFTDKELQKFGEIEEEGKKSDLSLIDISYNNTNKASTNFGHLEGIDISFKTGAINIVKGKRGSGKRIIFNMLRRNIRPDGGQIVLDGVDIFMYSKRAYNHLVYYAVSNPVFLNDTILNNLKVATKDKIKIYRTLVNLGLSKKIKSLPQKLDTNIYDANLTKEELFILGVARALLTNAQYIILYEIPNVQSLEFHDRFIEILNKMKKKRTVIIFTYSDAYKDVASVMYEIDNYSVASFKVNKI